MKARLLRIFWAMLFLFALPCLGGCPPEVYNNPSQKVEKQAEEEEEEAPYVKPDADMRQDADRMDMPPVPDVQPEGHHH